MCRNARFVQGMEIVYIMSYIQPWIFKVVNFALIHNNK